MNNLGQRIKELRKRNDLTQEKLADLLNVTYQSVSKWECGTTMPDLSMIVPLARVLHTSADDLLGMKPTEQDERQAYFDSEYFEFWKKEDHDTDYTIAKQAVEEYPEEYKYWYWLGSVEYYISFSRQKQEEFLEMMDTSIKHSLIAYENGTDERVRRIALWNIICAYRYSGRIGEARKYAELYPESNPTSRNDAIELCLEGEELLVHQQGQLLDALDKLCNILNRMGEWRDIADPRVRACAEAEKTIIETIIPDGNTLRFSIYVRAIHEKLADIALEAKDYDAAVEELKKAWEYAMASDRAMTADKQYYTGLLLDRCDYDYSNCRQWESTEKDLLLERLRKNEKYDPLRERADFHALIDGLSS